LIAEIGILEKDVKDKALLRIKYEGLDKDPELADPKSNFYQNLEAWAMFKLAYYQCFKCKKSYFGGKKDCIRAQ
jgi:E3 ubiquitin-protein ligase MYCBP2